MAALLCVHMTGCDEADESGMEKAQDMSSRAPSSSLGDSDASDEANSETTERQEFDDEFIAKVAWRYFERNIQPKTGLVNSVDNYPSTTMWDAGSSLMAMISAERLQLIRHQYFEDLASKALRALQTLQLYDGKLPNKVYNTESLAMVNYANLPAPEGLGWSAIDVARLTVPLMIIMKDYPALADLASGVIDRMDIDHMIIKGELFGGRFDTNGKPERVQEGRLGYEEYSAEALLRLGRDTRVARRVDDTINFTEILGIRIASDSRAKETYGANVVTTSEPYLLYGLEFGFDADIGAIAESLIGVQEERWRRTGILTALTEGHIDQAPYFVYNGIIANGTMWSSISPGGDRLADVRTLSVKAALGWHALYDNDYTKQLQRRIAKAADPDNGWRQGFYEVDGRVNKALTANTNAVVLEALCFMRHGPFLAKAVN